MSVKIKNSLKAGLWFIPIGLLVGGYISYPAYEFDITKRYFFLYAAVSIYFTSIFFWWIFVEKNNQHSLIRYTLIGSWNGFASHHLCWYLIFLSNALLSIFDSNIKKINFNPILDLYGALLLSFFSWFIFGIFTVTLGALAGGILWWKRSNFKRAIK